MTDASDTPGPSESESENSGVNSEFENGPKKKDAFEPNEGEITRYLRAAKRGESNDSELFPMVYNEMRRLAQAMMGQQNPGHSLQATDLVHNVYIKLVRAQDSSWENKKHFMAVAARAMRSILVDHARAKGRKKRKAGDKRVPLDEWVQEFQEQAPNLVSLNEGLEILEKQDPRMVQVVDMRFFGGFTIAEIAEALGVSERTIERSWKFARTWLKSNVQAF